MSESENRRFERREAELDTTCASEGRTYPVSVCNISEGGCLVEGEGLALVAGARARIRISSFGTFDGMVKWADEGRGGIAFDQPLHDAVVRYVSNRTAASVGVDVTPRDRFGRALPAPPYPPRFGDILGL